MSKSKDLVSYYIGKLSYMFLMVQVHFHHSNEIKIVKRIFYGNFTHIHKYMMYWTYITVSSTQGGVNIRSL